MKKYLYGVSLTLCLGVLLQLYFFCFNGVDYTSNQEVGIGVILLFEILLSSSAFTRAENLKN